MCVGRPAYCVCVHINWIYFPLVAAVGLRNADYNGLTGTIVRWMVQKARYTRDKVDFDGAATSIKPANLSRV